MTLLDQFAFDIGEIPFSLRGSWLDLSRVIGLHRSSPEVHLVTHTGGMHPIFRLVPVGVDGAEEPQVIATAATLSWRTGAGEAQAVFASGRGIRFRGRGFGLRFVAGDQLTPFTGGYLFEDPVDGALTLTSYESGRRYRFTVVEGSPTTTGVGALGQNSRSIEFGAEGAWEVLVEEIGAAAPRPDVSARFDDLAAARRQEFAQYLDGLHGADIDDGAIKAAYVLWSATVAPAGFVRREAVLMSKHWMDKVWSWDHCFNAIALAGADPRAALDQFLVPFDHQEATGAIPDSVTHSEVLYNFVKPPIHGWAFAQLRRRTGDAYTEAELTSVYEHLSAWTRFWLDHRRRPGHRLPYYQHGNDSGWDNSTTFDAGGVVESPDLASFLILQLRELHELGRRLGRSTLEWEAAEGDLTAALFEELWTGERFVARLATTGEAAPANSLLNCLPIVLGELLPREIADALERRIGEHLTAWGPATEPVGSPEYEDDGYWRGPIWAPSTALIEDGLRRAGRTILADEISARFRALCETSGFAENFDARTGAGLRDRAYSWTAAAYLTLRSDAAQRGGRTA
ncbi:glycogen debranching protein [Leifsonia sp. ZF2019]|uniref:amylo-alpha-1,6-glucosidase n=1 Tax=Leifsonia sp. ZF2019 TaxID=2781978 RepID=UPI001CC1BCF8|nr:glycogen debranching protein [Leifsonia sp. ZF2019]UAJ80213.1 glycogen debranching protein [Leifsonia sp. ZF2019]